MENGENEDVEVMELKDLLEDFKNQASDPMTKAEWEAVETVELYIDEVVD